MSLPQFAAAGLQSSASVHTSFHPGAFAQPERRTFAYLDRPIASFGLPLRASNALIRAGVLTAGDAVQWTVRDLRTLPGFGPASVAALQSGLQAMGLGLRQPEIFFGR